MRLLVLVFAALLLASCQQERLTYDGKTVTARGWQGGEPADGWQSVLKVELADAPDAPPLAGTYARRGGAIIFTPAFPPSPEVTLRIIYKSARGEVDSLVVPGRAPAASAAVSVQAIYPTTGQWPANQLKFYIQFSGAMSKGQAWSHIQLLDEQGRRVEEPFVEIDQELWDPAVTRLTVLFDPGRIKRGLGDTDPPLVPGRSYTLRVDPAWQDAKGKPLSAAFERKVVVAPEVRLPVDPKTWKVTAPKDRDAPLVIDFPRPLDNALARRTITVDGVEGQVDLMNDETRWVFRPAEPWKPGRRTIRIDGILEDLAGNRLYRLFDVDTSDPAQTKDPPKFETLYFDVK